MDNALRKRLFREATLQFSHLRGKINCHGISKSFLFLLHFLLYARKQIEVAILHLTIDIGLLIHLLFFLKCRCTSGYFESRFYYLSAGERGEIFQESFGGRGGIQILSSPHREALSILSGLSHYLVLKSLNRNFLQPIPGNC